MVAYAYIVGVGLMAILGMYYQFKVKRDSEDNEEDANTKVYKRV